MKRNLSLLTILILLIVGTYYFEEIKGKKEFIEYSNKQRIFKEFNQLTAVKTNKYHLKKTIGWQVANLSYPASERLVQDFSLILGGIKIVGEVTDIDEVQYFKKTSIPFSLFVGPNEFKYQLGDVSELTGKFYVKRFGEEPKIFICEDNSRFTMTYKTELDLAIKKYLRLQSILGGQEDLFIERNLFHSVDLTKIEQVKIDNKRNRWFLVDLNKNITTPKKFESIKYKKMKEVMAFLFNNAKIKKLHGPGQHILTNPVSEIDFILPAQKSVKVKLYAGLNEQFGYYAKFKDLSYVFELDENSAKIFYTNVQDFWNKRFLIDVDFHSMDSFEFKLGKVKSKQYRFKVEDLKSFKIKPLDSQVTSINNNLMNFMFNLIFNLVDFREADYIEQIDSVSEAQLYLSLFKKDFAIYVLDRAVEVIDQTAGIKYHFNYNTEQLQADTLERIFTLGSN